MLNRSRFRGPRTWRWINGVIILQVYIAQAPSLLGANWIMIASFLRMDEKVLHVIKETEHATLFKVCLEFEIGCVKSQVGLILCAFSLGQPTNWKTIDCNAFPFFFFSLSAMNHH